MVTSDEKWILYDNQQWPAKSLDLEEVPKCFPKPDLHQKKKKGHGHCLLVCCWSDPLQVSESLVKSLHLRSMFSKPIRNQKKQCLQLELVNIMSAILLHNITWPRIEQPALQVLNEWGYEDLPHLPYSPHLSPMSYHFFKHFENFLQAKVFYNQ